MHLGLANGGVVVAPQDVNGESIDRFVGNNNTAWKAGWDFVTELYQQKLLAPRESSTGDQVAAQDFAAGSTAFMINYFNRSDAVNSANAQLEYGYLPCPTGPKPRIQAVTILRVLWANAFICLKILLTSRMTIRAYLKL